MTEPEKGLPLYDRATKVSSGEPVSESDRIKCWHPEALFRDAEGYVCIRTLKQGIESLGLKLEALDINETQKLQAAEVLIGPIIWQIHQGKAFQLGDPQNPGIMAIFCAVARDGNEWKDGGFSWVLAVKAEPLEIGMDYRFFIQGLWVPKNPAADDLH